MRRLAFLSILIGLFTVLPAVTHAQACDTALFSDELEAFALKLEALEEGNSPLEIVAEIRTWYETNNRSCQQQILESIAQTEGTPAYSFNSLEEGIQTVIGPLALADGFYRLRISSIEHVKFTVNALDGFCSVYNLGYPQIEPLIRSFTEVGHAVEYLVGAHNCEALITIGTDYGVWQLDFYVVDTQQTYALQETYSSDIEGKSPVIGPIVFEDGVYRITIEGENVPSMDLHVASGSCKTSQENRLFPSPNGGNTIPLTAKGCIAFITVGDLTDGWQLQFELRD